MEPSSIRNLGKVSFTYRDSGSYGEFMNSCRVAAWIAAIDRHEIDRGRVVDVGCSYGSWAENWRELGFRRVVGIDPNPEVVARARGRLDEVHQGFASDLHKILSNERTMAANGVLVHILEDGEAVGFLTDVARCLAPDGFFLYSVVSAEYYVSAGRQEHRTDLSCVRRLDSHRKLAQQAGLEIVDEIGTFIDPWAMPDLEFLASWSEMRGDRAMYRPFIALGELIRGRSVAPFSEVLLVTRLIRRYRDDAARNETGAP